MKRIIIGVVASLAIAGGAGYYYLDQMKKKAGVPTVSPLVQRVEAAMASSDLMALAHFNYDYAKHVDNVVFGPEQPSPLLTPNKDMHPLVGELTKAGVNIRQQVSHVIAGFHLNNRGPARTLVLTGKFNRDDITKALKKIYNVEKAPIGAGVLSVYKNDPEKCTKPEPIYIQVAKETIIISDPNHFSSFYNRLHSKATLNTARIANWPAFRDGKVFSVAIFNPGHTVENTDIKAIVPKGDMLNNVKAMFLGGNLEVIYPRGLNLTSYVITKDPQTSAQIANKLQQGLSSLTQDYKEIVPTLNNLASLINISQNGAQTILQANLNEETMPLLQNIPNELVSYATSQIGLSLSPSAQTPEEKTIAANKLPQYQQTLTKDNLPAYVDPHGFFSANETTGPFAIKLSKASWTTLDTHDAVELSIEVESAALPNITAESMHRRDDAAIAFLHIQDILDHDAYSILFPDPCGKNRYDKPIPLQYRTSTYFEDNVQKEKHYLHGTKTVRLDKNANIKNIAKIFGFIELNLPTETKTHRIPLPIKNKAIPFANGNVILKEAKGGSISYHLQGDFQNLLDVRALNKNNAYLFEQSASSLSGMTRDVSSISKDFSGEVHALELITAEKVEKVKYSFILQSFFDKFKTKANDHPTTQQVKEGTALMHTRATKPMRFQNLCKDKQEYNFKFGALCLNKLDKVSTEGVMGGFELFLEDSPSLYRNISAYEIALTHLFAKMKDGSIKELPFISNTLPKLRKRSAGTRDILYTQSASFGDWRGYPAFKDAVELLGVRGYINNYFPHRISKERLPALKIGHNILTSRGLSITIQEIENGRITLEAIGNLSSLVQIVPITLDGQALEPQNLTIRNTEENHKLLSFDLRALPIYLDVYHASSQDLRQQPIYFRTDGVAVDMSIFDEKVKNAFKETEFDKMLKDGKADIRSNVKEVVNIPTDDPASVVNNNQANTAGTNTNDGLLSPEEELELNRSFGLEE